MLQYVTSRHIPVVHREFRKENVSLVMFDYTFAFLYFQVLLTPTLLFNLDKEHKKGVKSPNKKNQWGYELIRNEWKSSFLLYERITLIRWSMPMVSLLPVS